MTTPSSPEVTVPLDLAALKAVAETWSKCDCWEDCHCRDIHQKTLALIARIESAEAERDAWEKRLDDVANGDGFTTEIRGVKIQKCDEYGQTDTDYKLRLAQVYVDQERQLVDVVTAERDAARADLASLRAAVEQLADEWECDDPNGEYGYSATVHREACMWCRGADELRELLPPARVTGKEAGE